MSGTEVHDRVVAAFLLVWPDLTPDEVATLSTEAEQWDSLAAITLLATLEEEFEVTFADDDVAAMTSFDDVLATATRVVGDGPA